MSDLNFTPRGPIYREDGGRPDYTEGYERDLIRWREQAYEEARKFKALSPENERVKITTKYIEGDHWAQFGRRAKYKSHAYINKTSNARSNHLALLTDTRPSIDVESAEEFRPIAEAIKGVIEKEWQNNAWDMDLMTVADIAGVCGTAFWKMSAFSPGVMRVSPCGPDMVMPIQPGFHLQDSTAVLSRTWKPLGHVMLRCNGNAELAEKIKRQAKSSLYAEAGTTYARPDHLDQWTWQALSPQMKAMVGRQSAAEAPADYGSFKSVEWQEYYIDDTSINESSDKILMKAPGLSIHEHNWWYWVAPGQRLYPRKRLVIFAGDAIFYDGPSPFWHGLYPFACLRLNPIFWSFWGLSKYRDLLPVNSSMNEIIAGTLDAIKKALNPTVVAKGQSIPRETWNQFFPDMPGAKLYLNNPMANAAQDIQFTQPPVLPAYVFQMLAQYLGPEFDKLSGLMDIAALGGKKQVPGGDTLEQMRDGTQTPLRREGRIIEVFLRDAGMQAVSNVLQFYSKERKMQLIGSKGLTIHDFTGDKNSMIPSEENRFDFWKQFPLTVEPGSMHGGAKDRRKLMFISLAQMGMVSRQRLLRELEIEDISDEELTQQRQALMGGEGGAPLRMSRGQRNGSPV